MAKPRGLSNNNPGNIIKTGTNWKGEVLSTDVTFEQFETVVYGYRALIKLLTGSAYIAAPASYVYTSTKGEKISGPLNTIQKIITKYCDDLTTQSYIQTVEKQMGLPRFSPISSTDRPTMKRLVMAISYVENGVKAIEADVDAAFDMLEEEKKNPFASITEAVGITDGDGGTILFGAIGIVVFLWLLFK